MWVTIYGHWLNGRKLEEEDSESSVCPPRVLTRFQSSICVHDMSGPRVFGQCCGAESLHECWGSYEDRAELQDRAAALPCLTSTTRPHPECLWANPSTAARMSNSLIYVLIGASAADTVRGLHRLCSLDTPSDEEQEQLRHEVVLGFSFSYLVFIWLF